MASSLGWNWLIILPFVGTPFTPSGPPPPPPPPQDRQHNSSSLSASLLVLCGVMLPWTEPAHAPCDSGMVPAKLTYADFRGRFDDRNQLFTTPPPLDMTGPRILIGGHRRTANLQGAGVRTGTERPQQSEGGVMGLACHSELRDVEAR